jgi:hypothetical protein
MRESAATDEIAAAYKRKISHGILTRMLSSAKNSRDRTSETDQLPAQHRNAAVHAVLRFSSRQSKPALGSNPRRLRCALTYPSRRRTMH